MHIIDLNGEEYPLKATSANDEELNGDHIFSATILPNKTNLPFIKDIAEMWRVVDHDEVEHVIQYVKRKGVGNKMRVEIKAIPLFFDAMDNFRIYFRHDGSATAYEVFNIIFYYLRRDGGHNFNFVLNGTFYAVQWEGLFDGETALESFKRALERYGAEFRIVGNVVYIENQVGRDTDIMYRHRLNASNIEQEIDANEMWTFARGYGDYGGNSEDGETVEDWRDAKLIREYTSPLAEIIGVRHAPPIKNGNITLASTMDEQLKTLVDESLKISVSADVHDLSKQGYPIAQSETGDRVTLIDERIGLNMEVRVIKQKKTRNWKGEVIGLNITFGTAGIAKRHQANMKTAIDSITELIEGRKKLPFSALDNAVAEATKRFQRVVSELQIPENGGLMAVEKGNPNNIVLFNSAGLAISNNGGSSIRTAITGDGIAAETIIGKILIGNNLLIENENSSFVVDGNGVILDGGAIKINGGLPDDQIKNADKWNRQGTYIDENGIYTGNITAEQITAGTLTKGIGRRIEIDGGQIESYAGNQLTMAFGSYDLSFYHPNGQRVGRFGPGNIIDTDIPGLRLILENNEGYFSIGHHYAGLIRPTFRTYSYDNNFYTMIAGPYTVTEDVSAGLYASSYNWGSSGRATDQAAFLAVRENREFNSKIYYGGAGLRNRSRFKLLYNLDSNTTRLIAEGRPETFWTRELEVGEKTKIKSSTNSARFGVNDNTYIYINDNGQVGFVHNGVVYRSFNP